MVGNPIARGKERPRKIIGKTFKKDLEANGLAINMIHDKTLWHRLIHVTDPT